MFSLRDKKYLLVVDYCSNLFEIAHLKDVTAEETILKLKLIFARNGIPQILMSDHGTNFVNEQFKKFASDWGFQHKMSSENALSD